MMAGIFDLAMKVHHRPRHATSGLNQSRTQRRHRNEDRYRTIGRQRSSLRAFSTSNPELRHDHWSNPCRASKARPNPDRREAAKRRLWLLNPGTHSSGRKRTTNRVASDTDHGSKRVIAQPSLFSGRKSPSSLPTSSSMMFVNF